MEDEITIMEEHSPVCRVCSGHCWNESINRERIGEIIGEASMCWSETPKGIFQSDKALKLVDELVDLFK